VSIAVQIRRVSEMTCYLSNVDVKFYFLAYLITYLPRPTNLSGGYYYGGYVSLCVCMFITKLLSHVLFICTSMEVVSDLPCACAETA